MRIILFTDAHYAAALTACGTRRCDISLKKLSDIYENMGHADAYINLGDLVNDTGDAVRNRANIKAMLEFIAGLGAPCFSIAGNHDAEVADKALFSGHAGAYSFDGGGIEWLALDCCCTQDGRSYDGLNFDWTDAALPEAQLDWLEKKLSGAGRPVVILSHQPLTGDLSDPHTIRNRDAVQRVILGARRPVRAILQGHYHPGARRALGRIPSWIFPALCEGNMCRCAELSAADGQLAITPFEWEYRPQGKLQPAPAHRTF